MKQAAAYSIDRFTWCCFAYFCFLFRFNKNVGKIDADLASLTAYITCIDNVAIDVASKNETDDDSK